MLHNWLNVIISGRTARCWAERFRLGLLLLMFSPSSLYILCTLLWLSFQPSLRKSVYTRYIPNLTRVWTISTILFRTGRSLFRVLL
jgi:hypothetical protein